MNDDYNIEELTSQLDFKSNSLVNCGNVVLTNYEMNVLDKYNIKYKDCTSLKEIIYYIEDILNNDSTLDDLECISKSIAERDYYFNSNK